MFRNPPDITAAIQNAILSLSPTNRRIIAKSHKERTPVIFHGGCQGCMFSYQATTTMGILHCQGCQYMEGNWALPDLSIRED